MTDDDYGHIRTLVRDLDVRDLTMPDSEAAIRSGRRRRRLKVIDQFVAAGVVMVLVGAGAAWVVTQGRDARVDIVASPSPSPSTHSTASPSPSMINSPVIAAKAGDAVPIGSTGKLMRLSATGFCEESAPHANVPLGPCRTHHDPNDPSGTGTSSGAWGHVEVVTGMTSRATVSVVVTSTDGKTFTGTLIHIPGAAWQAYYVVLPWTPGTVVDPSHPTPQSDISRVTTTDGTGVTTVTLFN